MSHKYKDGDHIPSEVICKRLDELSDTITRGKRHIDREFTMRIPAELDRDPDLVLLIAAKRIRELENKLKYLEKASDNFNSWFAKKDLREVE